MVLHGVQRVDLFGRRATGCVLAAAENIGRIKSEGNAHETGYGVGEL